MKIVGKRCPNCNGDLNLNNGETEGKCPYCGTDYIIDDETIHIKHTVEIKDDYDIEMAITTLDKFKDYEKAVFMFRYLIQRFGHKEEVYIGLVRALTHDFTKKEYSKEEIDEINLNFNKYDKLASNRDVKKYQDDIDKINSEFYLNEVLELSDNFNVRRNKKLRMVKKSWDLFKKYSTNDLINKYNDKFNNYYVNASDLRKKQIKFRIIFSFILILILSIFIGSYIFIKKLEKPKLEKNTINYSTILRIDEVSEYDILSSFFSNPEQLSIKDYKVVVNKLELVVNFKNAVKFEEYKYIFDIVDDMGPVIKVKNCSFSRGAKANLNNCIESVEDFKDGNLKDKVKFDTTGCNFNKVGNYTGKVSVKDSDGYETSETISIRVTNADLGLSVSLSKEEINAKKDTKLNVKFNSNAVNKKYKLEYDKKYVSIKDNNITGLKKGETNICVVPEYDSSQKECVTLKINAECKSSYTFKFSGANEEVIRAGEDFCVGTYRFYAKVLNYDDHYNVVYSSNGLSSKYYSIWKSLVMVLY